MPYAIKEARHYFGASDSFSLVEDCDESGCRTLTFETRAAARAWIDEHDARISYTMHNESGRPSFTIYRLDRLPAYLAAQLECPGTIAKPPRPI